MRRIVKVLGSNISVIVRNDSLRLINPNGIKTTQVEAIVEALRRARDSALGLSMADKKTK